MDFIAFDSLNGVSPDPPQQPQTQAVNYGDYWQQQPISSPQNQQIIKPSKGKGRLKLALICSSFLVIGVAISNGSAIKSYLIDKPESTQNDQTSTTTPAPSEASPTPQETNPETQPIFNGENPDKSIRDIYISKSFEELDNQRNRLDETAADGVINDARAENKVKGTPYEVYLFRRLNNAIAEGRLMVGKGVDLTSPEGVRKGWIWTGQCKGLLLAWQRINTLNSELLVNGKVTPQYTATANLAAVLSNLVVAVERGAVARSEDFEQILRNQYQADQAQKKQEELLKLQHKAKGGDKNGYKAP